MPRSFFLNPVDLLLPVKKMKLSSSDSIAKDLNRVNKNFMKHGDPNVSRKPCPLDRELHSIISLKWRMILGKLLAIRKVF
jgi:hypothetical protein